MTDETRELLERLASDPDPVIHSATVSSDDIPDEIFHEYREAHHALEDYTEALYNLEGAAVEVLLAGGNETNE